LRRFHLMSPHVRKIHHLPVLGGPGEITSHRFAAVRIG